ncbi:hypothetical protein D3C84_1149130 [compost metagenome]
MHQRAQQTWAWLAELTHKLLATARAANGFASIAEHPFNLLIQLVTVGDYGHAGVWVVLQNPLGQQHH